MYPFLWGSIKAVSRALVAVVPTAKTLFPSALVALTKSMTSGFTSTYSLWISWSFIFTVLTGWKVPAPTLKLILITLTPFSSKVFNRFLSKWSPAVGAATESCNFLSSYTVPYLSLSNCLSDLLISVSYTHLTLPTKA